MALANLLSSGSYAVVDNIIYSKQVRCISFDCHIYADSQKTHLLSSLSFSVNGSIKVPHIESFELATPPVEAEAGKAWIVPEGAEGAWTALIGKTVVAREDGGWDHQENEGNIIFVADKDAYYKCGTPMKAVSYVSSREFERFFSADLILQQGVLKCCYEFVKWQLKLENAEEV